MAIRVYIHGMIPQPGVAIFLEQKLYDTNLRYAMVTNDAARLPNGELSRVSLLKAGVHLVKIFSPEHGIHVQGEDGKFQPSGIDPATHLPVISLYGNVLMPTAKDLEDVDVVLFDIPDIGCRFYTYLWTLTYVMEACTVWQKKLVVLDRPNPIGGEMSMAEGPWLQEATCSSYIGRWNIPIRHCCTLGELANYFCATRTPSLPLQVVVCKHWKRNDDVFENEDWFFPTSPAIQNIQTALLYPGTGFWEGVNVQEGRGTAFPFSQMGAPWIDEKYIRHLHEKELKGVAISHTQFTADNGRYAGVKCNGILLKVTNAKMFKPVATGITLLQVLMQLYPEHVKPEKYKTLANAGGENHLDKLLGIPNAMEEIRKNAIHTNIAKQWKSIIEPFLMY
jgi:uncharacterized protein YbbC (DUF1343 family)